MKEKDERRWTGVEIERWRNRTKKWKVIEMGTEMEGWEREKERGIEREGGGTKQQARNRDRDRQTGQETDRPRGDE